MFKSLFKHTTHNAKTIQLVNISQLIISRQQKLQIIVLCTKSNHQKYFSVVTCEALQFPENGYIVYEHSYVPNKGYPVGTHADFLCHYGYNRNGTYSRVCQISGNWNLESPVCDPGNTFLSFHIYSLLHGPYSICPKCNFSTIL